MNNVEDGHAFQLFRAKTSFTVEGSIAIGEWRRRMKG
jgi:hypothetical protein